jgi:Protein of unknown function (DUF732)
MSNAKRFSSALAAVLFCTGLALPATPSAHADVGVYLLNVTVRPVYHFGGAQPALDYGYGICDKLRAGEGYPQLVGDLKADFNTNDEFTASYLLSQASQELCPELIPQLRNSAAGYRPTG